MSPDPFAELKNRQREMWASFAPTAMFTTPVEGHLVKFAGVRAGEAVLDVGTGTGVVAITAARAGARVTALDLTPELLAHARARMRWWPSARRSSGPRVMLNGCPIPTPLSTSC